MSTSLRIFHLKSEERNYLSDLSAFSKLLHSETVKSNTLQSVFCFFLPAIVHFQCKLACFIQFLKSSFLYLDSGDKF